ncbi:MAG: CYTH domain-containing protein [Anaerovoracaceae bacterium]
MEIELKYSVPTKKVMEEIEEDAYLFSIEEEHTREKRAFKASYFDTEDHDLLKNDIAFRIRMEGDKLQATLKWKGRVEGALHKREEINVPLKDDKAYIMPSVNVFCESEIGKEVIKLVNKKPFICLMEMGFLRTSFKVDTGKSIIEVSLDQGEILTDKGNTFIQELELELFSGETEELMKLGERLMTTYDLLPGSESKFLRGLKLLNIR